jgi:hypothetical protein
VTLNERAHGAVEHDNPLTDQVTQLLLPALHAPSLATGTRQAAAGFVAVDAGAIAVVTFGTGRASYRPARNPMRSLSARVRQPQRRERG